MRKQHVHCFSCELEIIVTVTEADFNEKVEYCPFCSTEIMTEEDVIEQLGYDDEYE